MVLSFAFAVAIAPTNGVDRVRQAVRETQVRVVRRRDDWPEPLKRLDRNDAPALAALLPRIQEPITFVHVAERLYELDYKPSIPILLERYRQPAEREPQASMLGSVLSRWGYYAVAAAIRGLGSDSRGIRLASASVLSGQARFVGPKAFAIFQRLLRSDEEALRTEGVRGMVSLAIKHNIDRNGDYWRPADLLSLPALGELASLTIDADGTVAGTAANGLHGVLWSRGVVPRPSVYLDPSMASREVEAYRKQAASSEPGVRLAVLGLVSYGAGAYAEHYRALADPVPEVRSAAERLIARSNYISVKLLAGLASHPSASVRASVARLLGRSFSPDALPNLQRLTHDPVPSVRREALAARKLIESP